MTSEKNALKIWNHLFQKELDDVNGVILKLTDSNTLLIPQITQHIMSSGGKRMRPVLTILAAKLCGYIGERHINLAACIEFIHTATLLHDDVVDESKLRRGVATANDVWGNQASVLVGDYLLSKAFQIMAIDGSLKVIKLLSDSSAVITEGEVKQLMATQDITTSEETYIDIVASKTAQLFTAACQVGAVVAGKSEQEEVALESFGRNLGVAFQIIDDALDYSADQEALGKTVGDDFREGKITLPLIFLYQRANESEKTQLKEIIEVEIRSDEQLEVVMALLAKYDVLKDTLLHAKEYAAKAENDLAIFEQSDEKQALLDILTFSVNREF